MRRVLFILGAVLPAFIWLAPCKGADSAGAVSMSVKLEREPVNLIEPRYRAYVSAESNRFAFRLPPGYRLAGDPSTGTLTLASLDGNRSITIAIVDARGADGVRLSPEFFRDSLMRDYTNVVVAQEFWRDNAGGGGPGFDLQWKASGPLVQCKRFVYMSSTAGVLRFTATASRANFGTIQSDLDLIILSLQTTSNGAKPKLAPLEDRL